MSAKSKADMSFYMTFLLNITSKLLVSFRYSQSKKMIKLIIIKKRKKKEKERKGFEELDVRKIS